jgi:hypothetical protein
MIPQPVLKSFDIRLYLNSPAAFPGNARKRDRLK